VLGAWAAASEQGPTVGGALGLHKKLGERRVGRVRLGREEDDLLVAGDLDAPF
jgi:hypothetical protein